MTLARVGSTAIRTALDASIQQQTKARETAIEKAQLLILREEEELKSK